METIERIDRYLNNELTVAESQEFEQEMAQNLALRETLEAVQISQRAVQVGAIRAEVQRTHAEFMTQLRAERQQADADEQAGKTANVLPLNPPERRLGVFGWTSRIAASVMLLLLGYAGYQYASLDGQTLYADKFVAYQLPTTRGTDDPPSTLETRYRAKDFAGVVQQAATLVNKERSDHFLTAMAHMHLSQFTNALAEFEAVETGNQQRVTKYFEAETEYYRALAYLGAKQYDQAYNSLKRIRDNPEHPYREFVEQSDLPKIKALAVKE